MKKILSIRPPEEREDAPKLQKRGRGWNIAESRLDTLHEAAREMRRSPTDAQARLGEALAKVDLGKYRLRRHVVIGSAIADFACQALKLVAMIEEPDANLELDRRRDRSLSEIGIKVLRYPADAVIADADGVAAAIIGEMKLRWQEQRATARRPAR